VSTGAVAAARRRGVVVSGPTLIQSKVAAATTANLTATFDAAPTNGNTLIAVVSWVGNAGFTVTPSGWTQVVFQGGATHGFISIYYKVAGASEPAAVNFQVTTSGVGNLSVLEYAGLSATPLDKSAGAGPTFAASISSGTTATTATANELLIAAVATPELTRTYSNTWTNGFAQLWVNNRQELASQVVSATGAYSTTEAWAGGSAWGIGVIATFAAA
jgi:hypothetical protein